MLEYRDVVTSFIQFAGKILLLHCSSEVGSYRGRWAAVSGYLEEAEDPAERAVSEIGEEVGLTSEQVKLVRAGEPVRVYETDSDVVWVVHPFLFEANELTINLDWKHIEFHWVHPDVLREYETVPGLSEAFDRVRWDLQTVPVALSPIARQVVEIGQDRTHGASYLGRRVIETMRDVARLSEAGSPEDIFHDLLFVAFQLRNAQPSMATLRNLVAKLLYRIDCRRFESNSGKEFRQLVRRIADEQLESVKRSLDKASENCCAFLPEHCMVLTHSYSSTVNKSLELAYQSGKRLEVYVTESLPGGEGAALTKDLAAKGIQARLISNVESSSGMPPVDLVLVGADSVMANGSIVNKIGTRKIAALSNARSIPFYVVCETAKFNTFDFLGEPITITPVFFDLTPNQYVTKIITDQGVIGPCDVQRQIISSMRELYT